ncbi:hypothetical protein [Lachnoclostridium sp. Marseille-P6806]|nr:hypothetical protein [Lachnoclostridium sp. Marseille-P6806]
MDIEKYLLLINGEDKTDYSPKIQYMEIQRRIHPSDFIITA